MNNIPLSVAIIAMQFCGLACIPALAGPISQQLAQTDAGTADNPGIVLHGWRTPPTGKTQTYSQNGVRLNQEDLSDALVDSVTGDWNEDYGLVELHSKKDPHKSWWVELSLLNVEYCRQVASIHIGSAPRTIAGGLGSGAECPQNPSTQ